MKKLCLLILLQVIFLNSYSQFVIKDDVKAFARQSLDTYMKNVMNEKNYMTFGFESMAETKKATLGDPYQIYFIKLDELKNFNPDQSSEKLIHYTNKLWFPVEINGSVRLKLEIIDSDGKLIAGEMGNAVTAQEIGGVRDKLKDIMQAGGIENPSKISMVQIPALRVILLRIESQQGERFVPVIFDPKEHNLVKSRLYTKDEIFSILKMSADKIDPGIIR
jgi:hypothetical protein